MNTKHTAIAGLTGLSLALSTAGAFAAEASSQQAPTTKSQGMYSADQLMDADVYSKSNPKQEIGEIDDILLDNNMSIKSFVIETKGKFGLGGKSYVVSPDQVQVETLASKHASEPKYRVTLGIDKQQLASYPMYDDSWFNNAQTQASQAWQDTKSSASSAWTKIKNTTSNMINGTQDKASDAADATGDAAQNAADKTGDAADNAADKTSNAADDAADKASNAADDATDNN